MPTPNLARPTALCRKPSRSGGAEPPRKPRGFTLLELVLVLAVLAVLGLLVLPRLLAGRRGRVEDTARAALALSRKARALAAAEGRTYVLVIDLPGRVLRLARQRDPLAEATDPDYPELDAPQDDGSSPVPSWARAIALGEDLTIPVAELGNSFTGIEGLDLQAGPLEIPFGPTGESIFARVVFAGPEGEDALAFTVDGHLGVARLVPAGAGP